MNYSINAQPQYNSYGQMERVLDYHLSGNVNYTVPDSGVAVKLMDALSKRGMVPSLNVNAYPKEGCG
jgi:uncharacterized protein YggE